MPLQRVARLRSTREDLVPDAKLREKVLLLLHRTFETTHYVAYIGFLSNGLHLCLDRPGSVKANARSCLRGQLQREAAQLFFEVLGLQIPKRKMAKMMNQLVLNQG